MIPYGRQTIEEDDIQAVVDVLRSDYLTTRHRLLLRHLRIVYYTVGEPRYLLISTRIPTILIRRISGEK